MNNVKIKLGLISKEVATKLNQTLIGRVTENRVLIIHPDENEATTAAGIIIPGTVKDGVPRKGVIVSVGEITEEYITYRDMMKVGNIVTYGNYAGKELEVDFTEDNSVSAKQKFYVLQMNEIIFVEPNF